MINLGPSFETFAFCAGACFSFCVPAFAEKLSTFKDHLLYCEEVVGHDEDFTVFRQSFEACITASY